MVVDCAVVKPASRLRLNKRVIKEGTLDSGFYSFQGNLPLMYHDQGYGNCYGISPPVFQLLRVPEGKYASFYDDGHGKVSVSPHFSFNDLEQKSLSLALLPSKIYYESVRIGYIGPTLTCGFDIHGLLEKVFIHYGQEDDALLLWRRGFKEIPICETIKPVSPQKVGQRFKSWIENAVVEDYWNSTKKEIARIKSPSDLTILYDIGRFVDRTLLLIRKALDAPEIQ